MKHELSALELRILAGELNSVKGYYIDQFYQLGEMRFRMKLSSKEGKVNLNIEIPNYVALSNTGEISEEATGFAMAVRKRVLGSKITGISLFNNDRILHFSIERKDAKESLMFEMFGKGNLIITDEKMITLLALQTHEFTDRAVRKGEEYKPPKNEVVDLEDKAAIDKVFDGVKDAPGSDRLIAYLSRRLGIGSLYLEDAIVRRNLEPKVKIKDVALGDLNQIKLTIEHMIQSKGKAIVYMEEGKPKDIAVYEIRKYHGLEKKEMPLNEAVELFYTSRPREVVERNEEVERIESSLKRQEEIVKQMHDDEIACRIKGEFISAHVTQIGDLIKAASGKKLSEEELKGMAKGFTVKRIDRAKRVIIIEKEDPK